MFKTYVSRSKPRFNSLIENLRAKTLLALVSWSIQGRTINRKRIKNEELCISCALSRLPLRLMDRVTLYCRFKSENDE